MNAEEKEKILNDIKRTQDYVIRKKQWEDSTDEAAIVKTNQIELEHQVFKVRKVQKNIKNIKIEPKLKKVPLAKKILTGIGIWGSIYLVLYVLNHALDMRYFSILINVVGLPFSSIAAVYLTYAVYKKREETEYQKYNRLTRKKVREEAQKVHQEANKLNNYVNALEDIRSKMDKIHLTMISKIIPGALESFHEVDPKKDNYLIPVLAKYQDNLQFYFDLYYLIKTEEIKNLNEAIHVVEVRLDNLISQKGREIHRYIEYILNSANKEFYRIDRELVQVKGELNIINSELQHIQIAVKDQVEVIRRTLVTLNINMDRLNLELDDIQNKDWISEEENKHP